MTPPPTDRIDTEPTGDGAQPELGAPARAATVSRRRRRWYQFSLWSLFALTLLAALALLGWRWTIAPYRAEAKTMALVKRLGGSYQSAPAPPWMSRLAGEELGNVTLVNLADCDQPEEYLDAVARLPRLEILVVGGQAFTDEHVEHLSATKSLRWLILDSTGVSDDALVIVQAGSPELKVYHSQRRTIAAIRAMGGEECLGPPISFQPRIKSEYGELSSLLGVEFFDEPTQLMVQRPIKWSLVAQMRTVRFASVWSPGEVTDTDFAELAKSPHLVHISADSKKITDEGIRHLTNMPQLRRLGVNNSGITDAGLAMITRNAELLQLGLGATQVTDAGLAHLARLEKLENLVLDSPRLTDAGISHLRELRGLQRLYLSKTKLTDAGMAHLAGATKMLWLNLEDTQISDAGLIHLSAMSDLSWLCLRNTRITDNGLAHLATLQNLETVWLNHTRITAAGLIHLTRLPKLRELELEGTDVEDAAVEQLAKMTSLTTVGARNTKMTSSGVARLKKALPTCSISSDPPQKSKPNAAPGGKK